MKKADLIVYFIIVDLVLSQLDMVLAFIFELQAHTIQMYIFYCLTFIRFAILFRLLNYFIKSDEKVNTGTKKAFNIYSYVAIGFFFLWIVFQFFELLRVAE